MKKLLVNSVLSAGSVIFFCGMLEIVLRGIGFSYPNFYDYDHVIGHRLYPGTEGWFREEGEAYIRINSQGLRDREHTFEKPAETIRIAVLGDSYTEAFQVRLEDTFWAVMERQMNQCKPFGAKQIEVINFGISGDGTAQELLRLQRDAWQYAPDIVLLAFLTGNDIRNNSKTLEPDRLRPFFVLHDGALTVDSSFTTLPAYRRKTHWFWTFRRTASRYSRVLQLVNTAKNRYDTRQDLATPRVQGNEIGLDTQVYLEPVNNDWEEAWRITELLLLKMREAIQGRQSRFVVVTLSNGIQVHPDAEIRNQFMKTYQLRDLFYPDNRLAAFAQRNGLEMLVLAPMFQRYAEETDTMLHGFGEAKGFGHWNAQGHRLAGETLARYFCQDAVQ